MDVPWIGDDDRAGDWIASRLGPFGTVGGNVPLGYEAYLSFANSDDGPGEVFDLMESFGSGERTRLDHLLDVLGPATGEQDCVFAMWDGFGGMFREADGDVHGFGVMTAVQGGGLLALRGRAERRRLQREAEARYAALLPLRPARPHLELPHREYYLWRGPLGLAALFAEYPHTQSPTLFWPTDRSWFVATDLDSGTTEIGGSAELLEPLLAAPWRGRMVDPSGPLGT